MLLALAWRNLWRNARRTLITVGALSLGVMGVVFIHSYRESANQQMVAEITAGLVGHLQIHGLGYQADPELSNTVRDPAVVEASLSRAIPGARPVRRVLGYGLAGSGEASSAALIVGFQPEDPAAPSGLRPLVVVEQGRPLAPTAAREAVLGRELALLLDARPGSELVLVGQAADGSVANDRFTVVGTGDGGSAEMNANAVFLHLRDAQDFFGLGDGVHQILVRLPEEPEDLAAPLSSLRGALDLATLEALSWSEMLPELKGMMDQKAKNQRILDFVVLLIVGLGVLNTMTMSTFERTREFGVMASLGTRRRRILALVASEVLLQGVLGFALGVLAALLVLWGMGSISLAAFSQSDVMGVRFPETIRPELHWEALKNAAVTAFGTVFVGGFWPALRAARLSPVEATRYV